MSFAASFTSSFVTGPGPGQKFGLRNDGAQRSTPRAHRNNVRARLLARIPTHAKSDHPQNARYCGSSERSRPAQLVNLISSITIRKISRHQTHTHSGTSANIIHDCETSTETRKSNQNPTRLYHAQLDTKSSSGSPSCDVRPTTGTRTAL